MGGKKQKHGRNPGGCCASASKLMLPEFDQHHLCKRERWNCRTMFLHNAFVSLPWLWNIIHPCTTTHWQPRRGFAWQQRGLFLFYSRRLCKGPWKMVENSESYTFTLPFQILSQLPWAVKMSPICLMIHFNVFRGNSLRAPLSFSGSYSGVNYVIETPLCVCCHGLARPWSRSCQRSVTRRRCWQSTAPVRKSCFAARAPRWSWQWRRRGWRRCCLKGNGRFIPYHTFERIHCRPQCLKHFVVVCDHLIQGENRGSRV